MPLSKAHGTSQAGRPHKLLELDLMGSWLRNRSSKQESKENSDLRTSLGLKSQWLPHPSGLPPSTTFAPGSSCDELGNGHPLTPTAKDLNPCLDPAVVVGAGCDADPKKPVAGKKKVGPFGAKSENWKKRLQFGDPRSVSHHSQVVLNTHQLCWAVGQYHDDVCAGYAAGCGCDSRSHWNPELVELMELG